ncbi:cytochrome c [Aquimarina sp. I32.4]|uniref:c-type cytochrome n=1 Tax=Aquimarina sp. I32.4 TaxID=2053903 RepID=UPI000CDE72E7|nr:cytochrome c [Aquimarina sp. I32.4]
MRTLLLNNLILLFSLLCFGCSSSSSDDAGNPNPDPDPITNPNPNKTTTYTNDVKAILDDQCLQCHTIPLAQGAPFAMRTYAETINAINNREFFLRIKSNGFNVMPPEGRLPQETIDIILDWEADGLIE